MSPFGERGGSTRTFEHGRELTETHKPEWSTLIRLTIESALIQSGYFHADDLVALEIPEAHKACVGAQVSGTINRGYMERTGARRSTSDPAGHGRESWIYRITELGRQKLAGVGASNPTPAGTDSGHISPDSSAGSSTLAPAEQLFEVPEPEAPAAQYADPDQRAA